jgi:uncharacterized membrane protein
VSERVSLATSTGPVFLALAFHFATGLIALAAGLIAIAVRKGGKLHRVGGRVFVYAMIATGITAAGISVYEGKTIGGGAVIVYFVLTAYTAVNPLPRIGRGLDIALMLVAFLFAVSSYNTGFTALGTPGNQIDGVPAGMTFFMATILLLAAIGDLRMVWAGGVRGTRRLARHLWRMCFGLFIATGSFFIGQMKFIPEPIRIVPLLLILGMSPLVVLLYWMWRVRLKQNLRGLMTAKPIESRKSRDRAPEAAIPG